MDVDGQVISDEIPWACIKLSEDQKQLLFFDETTFKVDSLKLLSHYESLDEFMQAQKDYGLLASLREVIPTSTLKKWKQAKHKALTQPLRQKAVPSGHFFTEAQPCLDKDLGKLVHEFLFDPVLRVLCRPTKLASCASPELVEQFSIIFRARG